MRERPILRNIFGGAAGARETGPWGHILHDPKVMGGTEGSGQRPLCGRVNIEIFGLARSMLRSSLMRRSGLVFGSVVAACLLAAACGSMGDDESATSTRNPSEDGGARGDQAVPSGNSPDMQTNAVILVHAAGAPAFRLCFENSPDLRPLPDRDIMPEANVVGVEVGSAVRVPPLAASPGRVFLFFEAALRNLSTLSCRTLIEQGNPPSIDLGTLGTNLSSGVHLVVVHGCKSNVLFPYTKEQCGDDYEPDGGENLGVTAITLPSFPRAGGGLPAQLVHLSRAIESAKGADTLAVTFGDLSADGGTELVTNPTLLGGPEPSEPVALSFATSEEGIYATSGFRVEVRGASTTNLLSQSLARVQYLSSPTEIPSRYYQTASNYVLLLLGDPNAPDVGDAGPDERRAVHLLAVPVLNPQRTDGGTTPDGGSTTDGG